MSGEESIEVEVRRVLVGEDRAARLAALAGRRELAGASWSCFELREQVDRYFDLPGGALARGDRALRLRALRGELFLTGKGPARVLDGSVVARVEVELPWSPEALELCLEHLARSGLELALPAGGVPEDPDAALAALGLHEVQRRATTRRAAQLERDGAAIGELVLDEVRYLAGDREVLHREVELEARGATGADELVRLVDALGADDPDAWRAWPWSKTALGAALEALEAAGALAGLLAGDELTLRGYDRVDAWLTAERG